MPETKEEASVLKALLEKVKSTQEEQMEKERTLLENFLKETKLIRMKYEKLEEIQATHFNVFSILRKEDDEVGLHSRFIYELLNPNAEHKQKDVFLKAFLACSGNERLTGFMTDEISQAGVEREHRNIDILISTPNKAIIIENKIYAGYGEKQLSRYRDKIEQQGYSKENIRLVYLTLDGSEVEEWQESEEVGEEIIAVSYKEHITAWLKTCISEVALIPTMRETIQQYLQLVQKLTGQSHHKEETMEIKELFLQDNGETMRAFQNAQGAFGEAKVTLEQGFWNELKERLKDDYKVDDKDIKDHNGRGNIYFAFPICKIDENNNISLAIERNSHNLYYGFWSRNGDTTLQIDARETINKDMNKRLPVPSCDGEKKNMLPAWLWRHYYTDGTILNLNNFADDRVLALYFDENKRNEYIDGLLQEIKDCIKLLRESSEFHERKGYNWLI